MEIYQEKQTGLAAGAIELISVADAKSWAVVDTDLDDAVITSIIVSAREMVENFISKDLVSKDREFFVDTPEYDGVYYTLTLPYPAKTNTIVITSNTALLADDIDYQLVGLGGNYIQFQGLYTDVKVTYESEPIVSPSEVTLANSATKVLIEQIYDNRANLEGDNDILIMDMNIKSMLTPLKEIYL